jgi:hypothetical protein
MMSIKTNVIMLSVISVIMLNVVSLNISFF